MRHARRLAVAAALAASLAAGAVGTACRPGDKAPSYDKIELPGLAMELPKGKAMSNDGEASSYATGAIKVARVTSPAWVVAVSWQPGVLSTPDEFEALVRVMADAIGHTGVTPQITARRDDAVAGQKAIRASVGLGKLPMTMELVETTCGARSVTIVAAAQDDPAAMADKIIQSFECKPDAAKDAELAKGGSPVGFVGALPTGWGTMENEGVFTLTNGLGLVLFVAAPDVKSLDRIGFKNVIQSMMQNFLGAFESTGGDKVSRHGSMRELVYGTTLVEGEKLGVVATAWPCPGSAGVLSIAMHPVDEPRDAAVDVMLRARCLNPGEPAPAVAPFVDPDAEADDADDGSGAPPAAPD